MADRLPCVHTVNAVGTHGGVEPDCVPCPQTRQCLLGESSAASGPRDQDCRRCRLQGIGCDTAEGEQGHARDALPRLPRVPKSSSPVLTVPSPSKA